MPYSYLLLRLLERITVIFGNTPDYNKRFRILIVLCILMYNPCLAQDDQQLSEIEKKFSKLDSISDLHFKKHRILLHKEEDIAMLLDIYFDQIDMLPDLKGNVNKRFDFHRLRGLYFKRLEIYEYSNQHYLKAQQLYDSLGADKPDGKALMYFLLKEFADNYQKTNKKDSATFYYRRAISFARDHMEGNDKTLLASAINDLGIHYLETLYKPDSAMVYFQRAMRIMSAQTVEGQPLPGFIGSIRDNMANVYLTKNQLDDAKHLFEENFAFYHPDNFCCKIDYERWARAGIQVAETNMKLNELTHVDNILKEVYDIIEKFDFVGKQKTMIRYLQAKSDLSMMKGEREAATDFLEKKKQLQNDLERGMQMRHTAWNTHLRSLIIKRLNDDFNARQQIQEAKRKEEQFHFWIVILALTLVLSILAILLIIYRQRHLNIKQNKLIADKELGILTLENNLLNEKIEARRKDLSDFALNLSQNQEWTQALLKIIGAVKDAKGNDKARKVSDLEELVQQKVTFDNRTQNFHTKIDQLSNEFYSKLYNQFPDLTKADIKLCAMIRLGYDIYEIAQLQNIHFNSVYQSRYRLKKKLNLEEDQNLDYFLQQL